MVDCRSPGWLGARTIPQQVGATFPVAGGGEVRITGWSTGRRLLARICPAGTAHPTILQITVAPSTEGGTLLTVTHHDVPEEAERVRLRALWEEHLASLSTTARA